MKGLILIEPPPMAKRLLFVTCVRKVWSSHPWSAKSDTGCKCFSSFKRSCVPLALYRGNGLAMGPASSLHH